MNLAAIAEDLKRDEGFSAMPYRDSVGVWTIGYGTNITTISKEEALLLLHSRLLGAADDLQRAFPWVADLNDVRAGVLVNMVYNLGIDRFSHFVNTIDAVKRGGWQDAHDGMLASLWAKQVGPRAVRLAGMMLTGEEIK
jgi:lysozyme